MYALHYALAYSRSKSTLNLGIKNGLICTKPLVSKELILVAGTGELSNQFLTDFYQTIEVSYYLDI